MGLAERRERVIVILAEQRLALGIDDDQQRFARAWRCRQGRGHGAEAVDAGHGKAGGKADPPGGGKRDADPGEAARSDADGDPAEIAEVDPSIGEHLQDHGHQRLGMAALHGPAAMGCDHTVAPQGGRAGGARGIQRQNGEGKYREAHALVSRRAA